MSEAIGDMEAYTNLTDNVYYQILYSTENELKPVSVTAHHDPPYNATSQHSTAQHITTPHYTTSLHRTAFQSYMLKYAYLH